ncbi:MAG: hypothetical protein R2746_12390 [Acidimicrobiales bacterium]
MTTDLSPADLDRFAATYYLNAEIEDVDIEELAQQHSIPMIVDALGPVERVLEMGYGTGLITRELLAAGVPVEVVEGSPALREHAMAQHRGSPCTSACSRPSSPTSPTTRCWPSTCSSTWTGRACCSST